MSSNHCIKGGKMGCICIYRLEHKNMWSFGISIYIHWEPTKVLKQND
jgi:hypothetical protein